MSRITFAIIGALLGVLAPVAALTLGSDSRPKPPVAPYVAAAVPTKAAELAFKRLANPGRTVVRLRTTGALVATLTDGARTAVLPGPARTFAEPRFTKATVRSTTRVRLLPHPWSRGAETRPWFRPWLDRASASTEPDVLAVAMQYLDGKPAARDANGIRFRGDASFGPDSSTSSYAREEGSDFYDYLGVTWRFPGGDVQKAEPRRYGDVDCSGYVRLVFGYRMGLPLLNVNARGAGLPRRAFAIAQFAPGAVIVPNTLRPADDYDRLQPGDLVFFDISGSTEIDHAGIYLGRDSGGHHRFLSSRGRANGPTLGDFGGASLLDDGGYYSRAFRTAKRL